MTSIESLSTMPREHSYAVKKMIIKIYSNGPSIGLPIGVRKLQQRPLQKLEMLIIIKA